MREGRALFSRAEGDPPPKHAAPWKSGASAPRKAARPSKPAAKRRQITAHGASRGVSTRKSNQPRRGGRQQPRRARQVGIKQSKKATTLAVALFISVLIRANPWQKASSVFPRPARRARRDPVRTDERPVYFVAASSAPARSKTGKGTTSSRAAKHPSNQPGFSR